MKITFTKFLKFSILGLAFLMLQNVAKGQTNAGTDFWFNFPQDNPLVTGASAFSEKKFFMISYYNTKVKVSWPAAMDEMPEVTLTAGVPYAFEIPDPYSDYADSYAEYIDVNGIHITSEYPLAIYAISYDAASSEICPVLPIEKLGTEYLSVAYRENTGNGFSARVHIVATEDNTVVAFALPETQYTSNEGNSKQLRKPKEKWTINLKKGETYTVFCNQSGKGTGSKPDGATPKTGTIGNNYGLNSMKITSNKKIAVLGGADCTWAGNKQYPGCGACDITFTQLLPTHLWQKEFVSTQTLVRFNNTKGSTSNSSIADYLWITARDSNTQITITGKASASKTLQAGEYWLYESPGKGIDPTDPGATNHVIRANNPISICQIQKGWQCDNNQAGDPSQMWVFDTKSWQNNYNITSPIGTANYTYNYVNLIVKDMGDAGNTSRNIRIYNSQTGAQIPVPDANWIQIGTEPYFYNRVNLPAPGGVKLLSDSLFSFYASGSATANSYAYMGGESCIFDIQAGADSIYVPAGNPITPTTFKIYKTEHGKLVAGGVGELTPTYTWTPNILVPGTTITGPNPQYTYADTGVYTAAVVVVDVGGCIAMDTFKVFVLGRLVPPTCPNLNICQYTSATLSANSPSAGVTYEWYDAPSGGNLLYTGQVFTSPVIGQDTYYYVSVKNAASTSDRTAVLVTMYYLPRAEFGYSIKGNDVRFTAGYFYEITDWDWDFGDRSPILHGVEVDHKYISLGSYDVNLFVKNKCDANWITIPITLTGQDTTVVLGVDEMKNAIKNLSIFPNPFKDEFNVRLNLEKETKIDIKLTDVLGREIAHPINNQIYKLGNVDLKISMSEIDLHNQFIIVKIDLGNMVLVKKIIRN